MKKLGFFNKVLWFFNIIVALLLIVSFVLPYLPPKSYPILSILSLTVSPLILINIVFLLYWLVQVKRHLWLSLVVLTIAYFHFNGFYQISSEKNASNYKNSLRIASLNVRLFNAYEKDQIKDVPKIFSDFLISENPDVLFVQEYYDPNKVQFKDFPYSFINAAQKDMGPLKHAIFSKYPLLNVGSFNYDYTNNNVLYADVVKGNDTVRIYNLHLQSLRIIPSKVLEEEEKEQLLRRISTAFKHQQEQVDDILKHKKSSKYPVLICGDFNNTPFSYTYQKLHEGMKDAFVSRGNGLGSTFLFDKYPMRIDYILTDNSFDVLRFNVYKKTFSDHYPISATVGWDKL